MEDFQHQQAAIQPYFPATSKWPPDSTETLTGEGSPKHVHDGGSFGQDSGYNSYQATTSYNTFNMSSRNGASVTYATIDEGNENDCSLNESSSGPSAISLTPRTAASMDLLSKIHLTTPKTADRSKPTRRPIAFDYDGTGGTSVDGLSFLAPSTPERLPGMSRQLNVASQDTPRRTGNRSVNQPIQLTPHKAKGGSHSLKRKHSSLRGKLYSDGDVQLGDENRSDNLNDSFDVDCRRLEDISPILNTKRRKHHDRGIEDLMRSSTPKTVSSQPTFLQLNTNENRPAAKQNLRKIQSFSPSKMQSSYRRPLLRHNVVRALERTPEKKREQRVLAEIDLESSSENTAVPPRNFGALLGAPILEEPVQQLEQTVSTVPSFDDFSLTPSKASLVDPELVPRSSVDEPSFVADDFAMRHAPNYSYAPTLNSILEESPVRSQIISAKHPVPKTPPSISKSGRKLKRLGTNGSVSTASCSASPARSLRSLSRQSVRASVSPKVRRSHDAPNRSLKTSKSYNYCGYEYLNILHQLNKRNPDALALLLDYLADTDLVQVVRVSRGWRSIILNHRKTRKRLQRYLKQQKQNKENVDQRQENGEYTAYAQLPLEIKDQIEHNETPVGDSNGSDRRPFSRLNSRSFGNVSGSQLSIRCSVHAKDKSSFINVTKSPPVSPSMQKFTMNQKIASQLKPKEQLRPCPRCEHPSRIIFSRTSQSGTNKSRSSDLVHSSNDTANLSGAVRNNNEYSEKSPAHVRKNLFNDSTPSSAVETSLNHSSRVRLNSSESYHLGEQRMKLRCSTATKSFNCPSESSASGDRQDMRDSKCDYAICSGKLCGFKFCIKCLGVYHPSTACADLSIDSPTKEEDRGQPNVACSRQSRRSLLRLCRK
uniref:F-box domain-containing protein n=1 Tax=Anopheles culicifacies TaxID=139723 RepID=A0A182MMG4_9DIPT